MVGVIGLGSMGLGIAQSIVERGVKVAGYDVNPDAIDKARRKRRRRGRRAPPRRRETPMSLVVVVVNAAQTDAVLFGSDGAAAAMKRGGVIVACATMAPERCARDLPAKAEAQGLHYLDAPISGGAVKAAAGQLTVMASGSAARPSSGRGPCSMRSRPPSIELGDAAGIGASFKMVNQLLAGVHIAAACEAMTFAAKLGLDLPTVYKVITASAGNSWMFENRVPHILEGDYQPTERGRDFHQGSRDRQRNGPSGEISLADCGDRAANVSHDRGRQDGTATTTPRSPE